MTSRVSPSRADAYVVAVKFPNDLGARSLKRRDALAPGDLPSPSEGAYVQSLYRTGGWTTPEYSPLSRLSSKSSFSRLPQNWKRSEGFRSSRLWRNRAIKIGVRRVSPSLMESVVQTIWTRSSGEADYRALRPVFRVLRARCAGRKGLHPFEKRRSFGAHWASSVLVLDSSPRGRLPSS